MKKRKAPPYLIPLLVQSIGTSLLSCLIPLGAILLPGLSFFVGIGYWGFLPIFGFCTSLWLTLRGVNCYLAWLLPPICMGGVPWLLIGYPPPIGSAFLCAIISLVGAASGDVLLKKKK